MSQQSIQMGNSPDPSAAAAQAAAEAAALKAGEQVQITSTVVGADGQKRTDFQQTPGQAQPQPQAPQQGELILGKYKTVDDLAKAYKELESKLGQQGQPKAQTPETPQGGPPANPVDKAASEYAETGAISDETIAALESAGIPRATVENYVAGLEALAARHEQTAFSAVGGKDNYVKMAEWAAENLSEAELEAFNADVTNPKRVELAVKNLYARFQQTGTFEPGARLQGSNGAAAGDMFRSRHEMMEAMKDERYTKGDTAFHADVQRKIANAMRAGIDIFA